MLRSRFAVTALCAFSIFGALLAPVVASAQTSGNGGTTMQHQGTMNGSGTNMSGEQGSMTGTSGSMNGSPGTTMGAEPGMPASGHPAQTTGGDTMSNQSNMQSHEPMNLPMTGGGDEMPWALALAAAGALLLSGLALRRGHFAPRRH